MKTILLLCAVLLASLSAAVAADSMPPLLADSDMLKSPTKVGVGACEAPPSVAVREPAPPVCAAPPPVAACPAPPPVAACPAPRDVVHEVVAVPTKKRVVVEECYVDNVRRTGTANEVRTRTARKTVEVVDTKMVSEAKIVEVASVSGKSVRLARGVTRSIVPTTRKEVQEYQETYIQPVRFTYTEPVTKTRKVTAYVDDVKLVTRRVR